MPSPRPHALPALVVGTGEPFLVLHGFALSPRTYRSLAGLLASRGRVIVPSWVDGAGRWRDDRIVDALEHTLDLHRAEEVRLLAHSFGGALALELAARRPERVRALVLCDSIGLSEDWQLAVEAVPGMAHLYRLATSRAAVDFLGSWARHPVSLCRAAWWGFSSDRTEEIETVARAGVRSYVLWAERDTLLSKARGRTFADDLGASFTVAASDDGPTDHDWMYRSPRLLVSLLDSLGVLPPPAAASPRARRRT